jgi:hypothetical protein
MLLVSKKNTKPGDTVDGCEILHQLIDGKHPTIYRVSTILLVVQDFSHMQTQLSGSHRPRQSNCHQLGELQGPKLFKSKQKINHTVYVILVD